MLYCAHAHHDKGALQAGNWFFIKTKKNQIPNFLVLRTRSIEFNAKRFAPAVSLLQPHVFFSVYPRTNFFSAAPEPSWNLCSGTDKRTSYAGENTLPVLLTGLKSHTSKKRVLVCTLGQVPGLKRAYARHPIPTRSELF